MGIYSHDQWQACATNAFTKDDEEILVSNVTHQGLEKSIMTLLMSTHNFVTQ